MKELSNLTNILQTMVAASSFARKFVIADRVVISEDAELTKIFQTFSWKLNRDHLEVFEIPSCQNAQSEDFISAPCRALRLFSMFLVTKEQFPRIAEKLLQNTFELDDLRFSFEDPIEDTVGPAASILAPVILKHRATLTEITLTNKRSEHIGDPILKALYPEVAEHPRSELRLRQISLERFGVPPSAFFCGGLPLWFKWLSFERTPPSFALVRVMWHEWLEGTEISTRANALFGYCAILSSLMRRANKLPEENKEILEWVFDIFESGSAELEPYCEYINVASESPLRRARSDFQRALVMIATVGLSKFLATEARYCDRIVASCKGLQVSLPLFLGHSIHFLMGLKLNFAETHTIFDLLSNEQRDELRGTQRQANTLKTEILERPTLKELLPSLDSHFIDALGCAMLSHPEELAAIMEGLLDWLWETKSTPLLPGSERGARPFFALKDSVLLKLARWDWREIPTTFFALAIRVGSLEYILKFAMAFENSKSGDEAARLRADDETTLALKCATAVADNAIMFSGEGDKQRAAELISARFPSNSDVILSLLDDEATGYLPRNLV